MFRKKEPPTDIELFKRSIDINEAFRTSREQDKAIKAIQKKEGPVSLLCFLYLCKGTPETLGYAQEKMNKSSARKFVKYVREISEVLKSKEMFKKVKKINEADCSEDRKVEAWRNYLESLLKAKNVKGPLDMKLSEISDVKKAAELIATKTNFYEFTLVVENDSVKLDLISGR